MHQDREQALSFVAVISELTASIQRLKASHSLAEALTIVIALVLSVFGADATQERRSNGSSLPSAASKKPLSRSAKRRNRLDPEHRAALDAKRAEYLSAKSQRRAQESATAAAAAAQARVDSVVEPKSSKSPLPPPPHTSPTGLDPSLASTQHAAPAILERVHGAQDARSPIGTFDPSTFPPLHAKRAAAPRPPVPPHLHSSDTIKASTSATSQFLAPLPSSRAAVHAAIVANTRWKLLHGEGLELVLKHVIDVLVKELNNVDRLQWNRHIKERLGKIAGGACRRAEIWLPAPSGSGSH